MTFHHTPELLREKAQSASQNIQDAPGVVASPHNWQVPAATEKSAYDAVCAYGGFEGCVYLGVPWATVIDGLRHNATPTWNILRALNGFGAHPTLQDPERPRRVSVAQHIHAGRFIEFYQAAGVTDLFWSHATVDMTEMSGIRIHPFPLFPVQALENAPDLNLHRPRRWLGNFIGAFNPKVYLTDVREHIFADAGCTEDLLIIRRDAWHFDRAVYDEQMKGITPDQARIDLEARHKQEYLEAIRDSTFTLCPSGSGPNSIRIGESLALGSIPIILTRDLALPGDAALWDAACVIEEDSVAGYHRALARARGMQAKELADKQKATRDLYAYVEPSAYAQLIQGILTAV